MPIVVGEPGFVLTPVVFGPDRVPVVTDLDQARSQPHLAVLSAFAHGGGPDGELVLDALVAALDITDLEHADLYAGAVLKALPAAARTNLEASMAERKRVFHLDFLQESYERGEASAQSKDVLKVLEARGIEVPEPIRDMIIRCADSDQLDVWLRRAAVALTVADVVEMPDAA